MSDPLNCPICSAAGFTDPESCDHTKLERASRQLREVVQEAFNRYPENGVADHGKMRLAFIEGFQFALPHIQRDNDMNKPSSLVCKFCGATVMFPCSERWKAEQCPVPHQHGLPLKKGA